ncbi:hypothetical protein QC487_003183 [Listeria monocytogenes]|nr:hypothetical protein [Listeria monocytogenes]
MDGWIKLHRSILESDTYNFLSLHQKLIMIEILLRANFLDGFWLDKKTGKKVELKAGQLITSINKIKVEWLKNEKQISDKKIRNTLEKLQKLGFLSIKTTNNYTMLTVCNYSNYQREDLEKGEQKDKQGANKGQSKGNAEAIKGQQCKKEKKEKKKKNNKNNNKFQRKEVPVDWMDRDFNKDPVKPKLNDEERAALEARLAKMKAESAERWKRIKQEETLKHG